MASSESAAAQLEPDVDTDSFFEEGTVHEMEEEEAVVVERDETDMPPANWSPRASVGLLRMRSRYEPVAGSVTVGVTEEELLSGRAPWYERSKSSYIVGIAGGTASGKTSVCREIKKRLGLPWLQILSLDNFYRSLLPGEYTIDYNFDHPDAFDWDYLCKTVNDLKNGLAVQIPEYDFVTHTRMERSTIMYGADVILFEGILALHDPRLLKLMDLKIFVSEDDDIRLIRRIRRDISERGRTIESVLTQYEKTVKPSYDLFCKPTQGLADIVVPRGKKNTAAIDMLSGHIQKQLLRRGIISGMDLDSKGSFDRISLTDLSQFENIIVLDSSPIIEKFIESLYGDSLKPESLVELVDQMGELIMAEAKSLLDEEVPHSTGRSRRGPGSESSDDGGSLWQSASDYATVPQTDEELFNRTGKDGSSKPQSPPPRVMGPDVCTPVSAKIALKPKKKRSWHGSGKTHSFKATTLEESSDSSSTGAGTLYMMKSPGPRRSREAPDSPLSVERKSPLLEPSRKMNDQTLFNGSDKDESGGGSHLVPPSSAIGTATSRVTPIIKTPTHHHSRVVPFVRNGKRPTYAVLLTDGGYVMEQSLQKVIYSTDLRTDEQVSRIEKLGSYGVSARGGGGLNNNDDDSSSNGSVRRYTCAKSSVLADNCNELGLIHVMNAARDPLHPRFYYRKLPLRIAKGRVVLADAMVGTGNRATMALHVLLDHWVPEQSVVFVCLLASRRGLCNLARFFPKARFVVGAVLDDLDSNHWLEIDGIATLVDQYCDFVGVPLHEKKPETMNGMGS